MVKPVFRKKSIGTKVSEEEYAAKPEITIPQYIAEIAAQPWFRERVFDGYLWQRGLDGLGA